MFFYRSLRPINPNFNNMTVVIHVHTARCQHSRASNVQLVSVDKTNEGSLEFNVKSLSLITDTELRVQLLSEQQWSCDMCDIIAQVTTNQSDTPE